MINQILIYIGSAVTLIWGIAHLFPTKAIVKGFGEISIDNKHIITMEWIVEGITLIFIGVITAGITIIDFAGSGSVFIYLSSAILLLVLSSISLLTGYKINYLPFKLCPYLFTLSAILILLGHTL